MSDTPDLSELDRRARYAEEQASNYDLFGWERAEHATEARELRAQAAQLRICEQQQGVTR